MNIVFYGTNSNQFSPGQVSMVRSPSHASEWEETARRHPRHRITLVTQSPCMFLADIESDGTIRKAPGISYIVCEEQSAEGFAHAILETQPDVVVAVSFWQPPFDWNCLKDALVARELERNGVRTVCHSAETMHTCFDKTRTERFLRDAGFSVPRSVHVSHELYWAERGRTEISTNVYKEYVLSQISGLRFPVVIKDTTGLSSYGMEVASTYKEAVHYLRAGKTRSDRLVQEYIAGAQFGAEIYGSRGNYTVLPPLALSVNRFGITSPKQGIKVGPAQEDAALTAMLRNLAEKLSLNGAAQVDLILSDGKWQVLEVNPRLSGMTETYAAAYGTTVSEALMCLALGTNPFAGKAHAVCNFKLPLMDQAGRESLLSHPDILFLRQTHNTAARQEREKGYCEIVLEAGKLASFALAFPQLTDGGFLAQARTLMHKLSI